MATCRDCGKQVSFFEAVDHRCIACNIAHQAAERDRREADSLAGAEAEAEAERALSTVILSTEGAPDLVVDQRIDIVTAEFAVGMGILTDVFNAWRDVLGGRSKSYQHALKDARKTVLMELRREAHALGADAVLGVTLDYSEISGGGKSMLFLVAAGTAVKLAKPH